MLILNSIKMKSKTLPIFAVFLCMGFGDVVGPLVSLAKDSFHLSNFMAQLLPLCGMVMFGLLSVPMGLVQDKKGKKYVLTVGLLLALLGLLLPIFNGMYGPKVVFEAASMSKFYVLLLAILFLGAGATTLQVAGNPIMRDVSDEGKYSSNLSLAQSIKAIGSSLGFLVPPAVAMAFGMDWSILFPLFATLIIINLILLGTTRIEEKKQSGVAPATLSTCFKLFASNGYVMLMVLGIFFYVGAEVSMSSQVPLLMKEKYNIGNLGLWVSWGLFFLPILFGRAIGSYILRNMLPARFLLLTILVSALGILFLFIGGQILAFTGIVMIGLGFANIFPLIFSITVDRLPERTNELSGLMVTAIVGGALIPPITGKVADLSGNILMGFMVPLACIIYIAYIALRNSKKA
jgi:FHS family L-fucose permease-like MFS transporter